MDNQIPKPEIIDEVYKNKVPNKTIANWKDMILNDHIRIEDDNAASNHALSPSLYSPKEVKKRRQGLWFKNIVGKDEDKEPKNNSSQELKNTNLSEDKQSDNCFIKFIHKIIKYESSETGCIVSCYCYFIMFLWF